MNASDRSNRGGDKRMGGRGIGSKGVVSIILVSVFSIIILTSFSGYRERLPIFVIARLC